MRKVAPLLLFFQTLFSDAVTYELSGGRFGDNLIAYLHAKWYSYQCQIPLVYRPFAYSSFLKMDNLESSYRVEWGPLYICPYFPEDPWERAGRREQNPFSVQFEVNWKDPQFRQAALEMISPKNALRLISPPKNVINVAIHLREGGGYDNCFHLDKGSLIWPVKFPPFSFYLEGLLYVLDQTQGQTIYCYLFTDALDPGILVNEFISALPPGAPIIFDWRRRGNHFSANVLEDFFSLFNFDILIRGQSNFSMVPSFLHDYAIVYSPKRFSRELDRIRIDEASIQVDPSVFQGVLDRIKESLQSP